MKHNFTTTLILVGIFLLAQGIGLLVVNHYIDRPQTQAAHDVVYTALPYGFERPAVENKSYSFVSIIISVLIGTVVLFLLMKYRKKTLWRFWFFGAAVLTMVFALDAFVHKYLALTLALLLAGWRIFRPNVIIQNVTEVFIYGGLAALIVPMLNVFAAAMLLLGISIYDAIAVWKTKHMITLAHFQSESKLFAGIFIPKKGNGLSEMKVHRPSDSALSPSKNSKMPSDSGGAILGGGDIGFPLLFAGALMAGLITVDDPRYIIKTVLIPICAAGALFLLLAFGKKGTFYPAMPFISLGCFVGYGLTFLL